MNWLSKQKINKKSAEFNCTVDIYKTFHSIAREFFSKTHGTFFRVNVMISHKTINFFKKIKIMLCTISRNSSRKLKTDSKTFESMEIK
jgi:predicted acetyltransferase